MGGLSSGKTRQGKCLGQYDREQNYQLWNEEPGLVELNQAKQLKELQLENIRSKWMPTDTMLG